MLTIKRIIFFISIPTFFISLLLSAYTVIELGNPRVGLRLPLEGGNLEIFAAPGEKVYFYIEQQDFTNWWASPTGIDLILENSSINFRCLLHLLDPKAEEWPNKIKYNPRSGSMPTVIPLSFQVPSSPDLTNHTLSGYVIGTIVYPKSSGIFFTDQVVKLRAPFLINVVSPEESRPTRKSLWPMLFHSLAAFFVSIAYAKYFLHEKEGRQLSLIVRVFQALLGCALIYFVAYVIYIWAGSM